MLLAAFVQQRRARGEEYKSKYLRDVDGLPRDADDQESMRMRDVASYFRAIHTEYLTRGYIALDEIDRRINLVSEDYDDMS